MKSWPTFGSQSVNLIQDKCACYGQSEIAVRSVRTCWVGSFLCFLSPFSPRLWERFMGQGELWQVHDWWKKELRLPGARSWKVSGNHNSTILFLHAIQFCFLYHFISSKLDAAIAYHIHICSTLRWHWHGCLSLWWEWNMLHCCRSFFCFLGLPTC